MRALVFFLTFLALSYAVPKYRSFEDIDVKKYRDDRTQLERLYRCIKGDGVCEKLEADFKARGEKIVKTFCEDCRPKERQITRDLLALITQDDPFKLHTVLKVFDPNSLNSKSFLRWLNRFNSLYRIPSIPDDVIDEFNDLDEDGEEKEDKEEAKRGRSRFVRRGGLLGGLRRLLRSILGVVGV